VLLVYLLKIFP